MAFTYPQTNIPAFKTAPKDEMDITIAMNEEWQRDEHCVTGMDKALPNCIRANETSAAFTKI